MILIFEGPHSCKIKRRVVKKWANRYINPYIKDLPRIYGRHVGDVCGTSISIRNGFVKSEGALTKPSDLLSSMKRAEKVLQDVQERYQFVYLRASHISCFENKPYLYVRLIVFEDNPEENLTCAICGGGHRLAECTYSDEGM